MQTMKRLQAAKAVPWIYKHTRGYDTIIGEGGAGYIWWRKKQENINCKGYAKDYRRHNLWWSNSKYRSENEGKLKEAIDH